MSSIRSSDRLDPQGRRTHVVSLPIFEAVTKLALPEAFVLFIAADATAISPNTIGLLADSMVKRGASYAVCWGPGCNLVEEVFDWAWIALEQTFYFPDGTILLTTSHPRDTLEEALWFALNAATPHTYFAASSQDLVVLLVGDIVSNQHLEAAIERGLCGAA